MTNETAAELVMRVQAETQAAAQWFALQPEQDSRRLIDRLPDQLRRRCIEYGCVKSFNALPIHARASIVEAYRARLCYDYTHQAWIQGGKYQSCSHPARLHCDCYGRIHAGEPPAVDAQIG